MVKEEMETKQNCSARGGVDAGEFIVGLLDLLRILHSRFNV